MIDGLCGGGEEGEGDDPDDGGPAEGRGQHEEGDEDVEHERGRLAAEEHESPLEAVGDGAADEAEEKGRDPPAAHQQARVEDLPIGVDGLHPEDLGDKVEGLDEPNEHRSRQQKPEVPVAEGAEGGDGADGLQAAGGHEKRVYAADA